MSGGAFDYRYHYLTQIADDFRDLEIKDLLNDLAELAHDYEWYESGDYVEETYLNSLVQFKSKWFKAERNSRLKGYVDTAVEKLRIELYNLIAENRT